MTNPLQHAPHGEPPPGIGAGGAAAYDKSAVLRAAVERHGCRTIVETGLYYGAGSGMPLRESGAVESYIAIDYQPANLELAAARVPQGVYLLGDSAVALNVLLNGRELEDARRRVDWLLEPVLFWLDAHALDEGEGAPTVCPLLDELAAVVRWPGRAVVLVDDLHLMGAVVGWPTLSELRGVVDAAGRWERSERLGTIMELSPR